MTAQELITVLQTVPGDTEIKVVFAGSASSDLPKIQTNFAYGKIETTLVV